MIRAGALASVYGPLIAFALWGGSVPFVGPAIGITLDSRGVARLADHVIPGLIVLAMGLILLSSDAREGRRELRICFLALLASLWMMGSHLPLVAQALRGGVRWTAALFHFLPGILSTSWAGLLVLRALMLRPASTSGKTRTEPAS